MTAHAQRSSSSGGSANVAGKTRAFMPLLGFPPYVAKCNQVAAAGYEGFVLSS